MINETEVGKEAKGFVAFSTDAQVRLGRRTIEVHRVHKKPLHKIEASWVERNFKPHGWITLELVKKKSEDECRKIIKAYLSRVGKIHKQHVHALVRGGTQKNSMSKGKLHFHILYRFEHTEVCTRVMELVWKQMVRKILRKEDKPSPADRLDELELGVIVDCGLHRHLPKEEKDMYAHAYPYKRIHNPDNKGTTIEYSIDPKKHPIEWYLVGCPKFLSRCRRGKCEHHKKKHLMVHS
jgi:hypothetical protein